MNYLIFRLVKWYAKKGSRLNNGHFVAYRRHWLGCLVEYTTSGMVETATLRWHGRILYSHMLPRRAAA